MTVGRIGIGDPNTNAVGRMAHLANSGEVRKEPAERNDDALPAG